MSRLAHLNIAPNTALPPGAELPRKEWVSLNRLRTGVGRFGAFMYRWGLRQSAACQCGALEQTAQHLMDECPNFCSPVDLNLCHPGPSTREWLRLLGDIPLFSIWSWLQHWVISDNFLLRPTEGDQAAHSRRGALITGVAGRVKHAGSAQAWVKRRSEICTEICSIFAGWPQSKRLLAVIFHCRGFSTASSMQQALSFFLLASCFFARVHRGDDLRTEREKFWWNGA